LVGRQIRSDEVAESDELGLFAVQQHAGCEGRAGGACDNDGEARREALRSRGERHGDLVWAELSVDNEEAAASLAERAERVEGVVDFEQLYAALAEHGSERRTPLGGVGEDDEARHGDSVQSTEDGSMSTEARTSRPRGSAEPGAIARAMAPAAAWRGWRVADWSRRWKR
jgi:hypothetical protein